MIPEWSSQVWSCDLELLTYPMESFLVEVSHTRIPILLNEGIVFYTSGMVNYLDILLYYDCDVKLQ